MSPITTSVYCDTSPKFNIEPVEIASLLFNLLSSLSVIFISLLVFIFCLNLFTVVLAVILVIKPSSMLYCSEVISSSFCSIYIFVFSNNENESCKTFFDRLTYTTTDNIIIQALIININIALEYFPFLFFPFCYSPLLHPIILII